MGRCPRCGDFGTVSEKSLQGDGGSTVGVKSSMRGGVVTAAARRVKDIDPESRATHIPTGIGEFDRVLGGGLVAGQTILLSGEPGVGKSTLLLRAAHEYAKTGRTVLYISGEESSEQISVRAKRIGVDADTLLIADETDLGAVLAHIEACNPDLVIVDSVQTIGSADVDGRVGGVAQVLEVATVLNRVAKTRRINLQLVGQVTKTNDPAGPNALLHLLDSCLVFEGDRNSGLRLLRTVKNRFGPADEIACFEQTEDGLREVTDPSGLFSTGRDTPTPGVAVTVALEGRRALVTEIQALVVSTNSPNPRRGISGLDGPRCAMLVAITERHGGVRLYDKDSFLATVAGIKVTEPSADAAVCAALYTAARDIAAPLDTVFLGEVTLSGDIRRIQSIRQRLAEAVRLGYKRAFVPSDTEKVSGITLIPVTHIRELFSALNQNAGT